MNITIFTIDEVITALEGSSRSSIKDDAIRYLKKYRELIKERTSKVKMVDPKGNPNNMVYKCRSCDQYIHRTSWGRKVNYCSSCGAKLDWSDHE